MSSDFVPHSFSDPISHEIMDDPVIAEDGYTYSRSTITKWLNQTSQGNAHSPLTGLPIGSKIVPNESVHSAIDLWKRNLSENLFCSDHNDYLLEFFCESCRVMCCERCFSTGTIHRGHNSSSAPLSILAMRAIIEMSAGKISARISHIQPCLKKCTYDIRHAYFVQLCLC